MSVRPRAWLASLPLALTLAPGCRSGGTAEELRPAPTTAAMPSPGVRALVQPPRNQRTPAEIAFEPTTAELGSPAPDFELRDLSGRPHRLAQYRGKIVVLEWFDPQCPFVTYAYDDGPLAEMKTRYVASGIVWLTLEAAHAERVEVAADMAREFAEQRKLRSPILIDRGGAVGRRYGARTTPHLFVVNDRGVLVYSGALDNAPMGRVERASNKSNYVDAAISDLRSGHAVTTSSTRPYGSAIAYPRP